MDTETVSKTREKEWLVGESYLAFLDGIKSPNSRDTYVKELRYFCRKKIWFERALSSTLKKEQGYNTYYCSNCELYFVLRRYDSVNGKAKGIVTMDVMPDAREVTRRGVHS